MSDLVELGQELKSLRRLLDNKEKTLAKLKQEQASLQKDYALLEKTQDLLRNLLQRCLTQEIKPIEEFCTYGLKQVFFDRDLAFKVVHKESASDVNFEFKILDGLDLELPVEDSVGGSVLEVTSFMLRVLLIMRLNKERFIFMDEFFTGMGSDYRPALMQLMKLLAHRFNFVLVLVTHETDFQSGADKIINVFTANNSLHVKEIDNNV